ncbi:MAG TPA: peptidylprolyl isomerase [Gemmatimonadales bacterium]|nr:peptidylprolyl isomerase [Gemmatimonadales bacterium]
MTGFLRTLPAILLLAACAPGPSPLLQPQPEAYERAAPDSFVVRLETTKGDVDIIVRRHWSPNAADRFHYLVRHGFYDDIRIFRVVPDFVAQFGLPGDTAVAAAWRQIKFTDEPVRHSNLRGTLSFARGGENTRGTQVYINLRDNARLDTLNGFGFPPFAEVIVGMESVDSLYSGYGARGVTGPDQGQIAREGNAYLDREFPKLDAIRRAQVLRSWK